MGERDKSVATVRSFHRDAVSKRGVGSSFQERIHDDQMIVECCSPQRRAAGVGQGVGICSVRKQECDLFCRVMQKGAMGGEKGEERAIEVTRARCPWAADSERAVCLRPSLLSM